MDCCGNCDLCVQDEDGQLSCAITSDAVGEYDCCPDHQSDTFLIDDDDWIE